MTTRTRHTAALGPAALAAAFVLLCSGATAAGTVSPLPPSAYTVREACPPPSPGHATCLALQLVPRTAEARAYTHPLGVTRAAARAAAPSPAAGQLGLRPQDLHTAYQLPTSAPSAQTIALVDSYNDLSIEADLEAYDKEFHLPACGGGCFEKVNQNGEAGNLPFPKTALELETAGKGSKSERERAEEAEGWTVEISLDVETAHAICQSCHIALVEADAPSYEDLGTAEDTAVQLGATEVSNSWGGPECVEGAHGRECVDENPAFHHPGTVITAAAGDYGYLGWDAKSSLERGFAFFPASSPSVVAVGGTRLSLEPNSTWAGETVWNGDGAGGGGCSAVFEAQPWQQKVSDWSSVECGDKRAVADVAADADPYTGVAVRDSSPSCQTTYEEGGKEEHLPGWCTIGGTSLASPIIASVYALAGGAGETPYPARTLYESQKQSPGSLHDVVEGSNGECGKPFEIETGLSGCTASEEAAASCSSHLICLAGTGYDGPSGVGTPNGIAAFQPPAGGGGEEPTEEKGKSGGGQSESPGSGGGSTSGGSSSSSTGGSSGSPAGAATATATGKPSVQLSGLALTLKTLIALNTSRPTIPQLGFTFTINVAARVRVSLAKRVRTHGHARWQVLPHSLTITAVSGRNSRHLGGHGVLSTGAYRLTLAPVHGTARSIVFEIG